MYELTKQVIRAILPESTIQKHSRFLRSVYGVFLRGNNYQCNVCQTKLRKFIKLKSNDLLCPICGSLPRTRGLWNLLEHELKNKTVLHFSPQASLKDIIEKQCETKNYITTDFDGLFEAEYSMNIEDIDLANKSIDVIICYHVLEHVENDKNAMAELFRILKEDGICYVQTPFKEGSILEDKSIVDPKVRLKIFGQVDHLRIYSPKGLKERLESVGFKTDVIEIHSKQGNYYGLNWPSLNGYTEQH